jgi:LmbE family N-acetylglucosaminyl deacetylase
MPRSGRLSKKSNVAFAIAAHPDDIEFYMAGTLLLLRDAGFQIHYMTLASGSCGSLQYSAARTRTVRRAESKRAASLLGATYHPSLVDDLEILYTVPLLRKLAAIVRQVRPNIVLTHSPQDYMEDHVNCSRLAATAAFARGMPNFRTTPAAKFVTGDVTVYHAMPHGLRDPLRRRISPELFIDTASVHEQKRQALAAHDSQKAWLDASQGMDSYLKIMDSFSSEVGAMSGRFSHAEGWRRHLHLGFCDADADPLRHVLGKHCIVNDSYIAALEKGI